MSVPVPDPAIAGPLREALARSNYNTGGVMVALGGDAESSPGDAPVQARRLGSDDQAVLVRLFLLGLDVDADRARTALAPARLEELEGARMIQTDSGGRVRCPIRISPFERVLLAHDPEVVDDPAPDIVTGLNSAARTLASLTPRRPAGRALDVGTGSGVQALLAAKHSGHVVATDVNPRALAFTRLGAALSGFDHVECREGSFFDPVEGEEFDLVVSNPPYVISPDAQLVYRDGGLERDEVSRIAVSGAASHLAEGGLAMVLANWVHQAGEPWDRPLREWLQGSGCDALLLHHLSEDGLEYAAKWNTRHRRDPATHARVLDRWTGYYRDAGIGELATGGVALRRRRGGEPSIATAEMATGPAGSAGEHVLRILDAAELLAERGDDSLLATPFAVVPGHRLHRERTHTGEGYGPETVRMVLDDSAGLSSEFGPAVAAILAGLDGTRTPGDLVPLLAQALPGSDDEIRDAVLAAVRTLVEQGLVEPAAAD
ncbi:MAG: methyltransferase [Actinomycetota bacterium]|nr:methyltransferase [Actinomycetota bacterium]